MQKQLVLIETIELKIVDKFSSVQQYIDYLEDLQKDLICKYNHRENLSLQPTSVNYYSDYWGSVVKVFALETDDDLQRNKELKLLATLKAKYEDGK